MNPAHHEADLFAPPPADAARLVGTIEGPRDWHEGLCAGLRAWCGPVIGWRDFGDVRGLVGCIVSHQGRLSISLSFDLGPGPSRPLRGLADDAEAAA